MAALPKFIEHLFDALYDELEELGIDCKIQWESIPPTKLYRLYVVSDDFENLRHHERQDVVWNIAKQILTPQQLRRVALIHTVTEHEDDEE